MAICLFLFFYFAVIGALEASKIKEQALSLLLSEQTPNPVEATNSAGLHSEEGTAALGEKGSSGTKHVEP